MAMNCVTNLVIFLRNFFLSTIWPWFSTIPRHHVQQVTKNQRCNEGMNLHGDVLLKKIKTVQNNTCNLAAVEQILESLENDEYVGFRISLFCAYSQFAKRHTTSVLRILHWSCLETVFIIYRNRLCWHQAWRSVCHNGRKNLSVGIWTLFVLYHGRLQWHRDSPSPDKLKKKTWTNNHLSP